MKLKRRQLLFAGLAKGVVAKAATDYLWKKAARERQASLELLASQTQRDPSSILETAFEADAQTIKEVQAIQASVRLTPPTIPYNRQMSQLLVRCSKLATQQYLAGKFDPTYDGSIASLKAYSNKFYGYTQIAAFKGQEEEIEEAIEIEIPVVGRSPTAIPDLREQNVSAAESGMRKTVKEVIKRKKRIPVYYGFVLASKTSNIIVFRGTQRQSEWLQNFTAFQKSYTDLSSGLYCGKVHRGFIGLYKEISNPLPGDLARQLNPSVPCYISGHSLGAALATLAALDIALHVPQIKTQIQLYTYAGPRVGDPVFAEVHSKFVPNSYRVVNLADPIPMMPPTKLRDIYIHQGQEWSFLSQNGDVLPNHVVDTYRTAVDCGVENNQSRNYPNSGLT